MSEELLAQAHIQRADYNRKTINRIRRIQGQLSALEEMISADDGSCEDRVLRARTIEKGMTSLINHLFDCYIENTLAQEMSRDPGRALNDMQKILKLINS
ncbi:MAG: metal-sensing transcriptional repressor [Chloroflexota bacterium]|nr:metal-sensing transcriptional repressor [Chloroflexota bacterium]